MAPFPRLLLCLAAAAAAAEAHGEEAAAGQLRGALAAGGAAANRTTSRDEAADGQTHAAWGAGAAANGTASGGEAAKGAGRGAGNAAVVPVVGDRGDGDAVLGANYSGPGACSRYGCHGSYHHRMGCQCYAGCARRGDCCGDYQAACHGPEPASSGGRAHGGNVKTLYHQTSREIGTLILKAGFQPGTSGWCGGGIYFAATPAATFRKAIGPDSHQGFMIEARVDLGRVSFMPKNCGHMDGARLRREQYDSVSFDPGDGVEYVVYSPDRVLSTKRA